MSQLLITPEYYKNLFNRWTDDIAMLPDFPTESKEKLVALHFVMLAFADGEEYSMSAESSWHCQAPLRLARPTKLVLWHELDPRR